MANNIQDGLNREEPAAPHPRIPPGFPDPSQVIPYEQLGLDPTTCHHKLQVLGTAYRHSLFAHPCGSKPSDYWFWPPTRPAGEVGVQLALESASPSRPPSPPPPPSPPSPPHPPHQPGASPRKIEPSSMAREAHHAHPPPLPAAQRQQRVAAGFSENYRGNPFVQRNRCTPGLPPDQNVSFFLTGLPADVTTHALLAALAGTGRVWSTFINAPNAAAGHARCAASVTFFDVRGARAFWARSQQLVVGGRRVRVMRNRNALAAPREPAHASRVLTITGPPQIVNFEYLDWAFRGTIRYELDGMTSPMAVELRDGRLASRVEFRFGSYRAQAETAYLLIRSEPAIFPDTTVWYGRDPCAGGGMHGGRGWGWRQC